MPEISNELLLHLIANQRAGAEPTPAPPAPAPEPEPAPAPTPSPVDPTAELRKQVSDLQAQLTALQARPANGSAASADAGPDRREVTDEEVKAWAALPEGEAKRAALADMERRLPYTPIIR